MHIIYHQAKVRDGFFFYHVQIVDTLSAGVSNWNFKKIKMQN